MWGGGRFFLESSSILSLRLKTGGGIMYGRILKFGLEKPYVEAAFPSSMRVALAKSASMAFTFSIGSQILKSGYILTFHLGFTNTNSYSEEFVQKYRKA